MAKIKVQYGRPTRSSRKECVRSPSERTTCGEGNWRLLLEHGWEKVLKLECLFVRRARGLSLSVYVDNIKLAGKTENIEPSWNCFHEDVDLEEPTSFLDHVYLGCTQRECQIRNDIVANYKDMFESRISAGAKEKLPTRASGKLDAETISSWSCDMEGHAKKCVEGTFELANKNDVNNIKSHRHAMDDHQFKEEENGICWRLIY